MPDVRGRTVGAARRALEALGHQPGLVEVDPGVDDDEVVASVWPDVGRAVDKSLLVLLTVQDPVTTSTTTVPTTDSVLPPPTSQP